MTRRTGVYGILAISAAAAVTWLLLGRGPALPPGLEGSVVFVSDRDGIPALYWRRLPGEGTRRLTFGSEGVGQPAISPDGRRVAFSMNGRVGIVDVTSGEERIVTFGVDWEDATPAWLPDGSRLLVSARAPGRPAGLHLLAPHPRGQVARRVLTQPRHGDDTHPTASPEGAVAVFVREGHLFRVDLADGRTRRLTGGFRNERSPRFLPDGRLICAWSEGKRHGIDVLDAEGGARHTLVEGGAVYRTLAPSPDGRFLAATSSQGRSLHPLRALLPHQTEDIHLLDLDGRERATLESSPWHTSHSPDWGH